MRPDTPVPDLPVRVGILISGRGSNMQSLVVASQAEGAAYTVALVASDKNHNVIIQPLSDIPCPPGEKHLEHHYHFVFKHALPRLWFAHGHTPQYWVEFGVGLVGLPDQHFSHHGHLG